MESNVGKFSCSFQEHAQRDCRIMNTLRRFLSSIRALGKERIRLLGVLTAGHFIIHWFQQFYPVILPALKSGLNLTNVEVGALTSAQQVVVGLGQLPCGMVADALVRRRGDPRCPWSPRRRVIIFGGRFSSGLCWAPR
jgi:MFS family permease